MKTPDVVLKTLFTFLTQQVIRAKCSGTILPGESLSLNINGCSSYSFQTSSAHDWVCLNSNFSLLKQVLSPPGWIIHYMDFTLTFFSFALKWCALNKHASRRCFGQIFSSSQCWRNSPSHKARDQTTEAAAGYKNPTQTSTLHQLRIYYTCKTRGF